MRRSVSRRQAALRLWTLRGRWAQFVFRKSRCTSCRFARWLLHRPLQTNTTQHGQPPQAWLQGSNYASREIKD